MGSAPDRVVAATGTFGGMAEPTDADIAVVIHGELRLLRPEVRRSAELVERLLHPDFFEFGASGRRWDRAAMIESFGAEPADGDPPAVFDLGAVRLADSVILVTYRTDYGGRLSWRSSLWRRLDNGSWCVYFHQGTPITDGS